MINVTKDSSLDEIKKEFELVNQKMESLEAREPADYCPFGGSSNY